MDRFPRVGDLMRFDKPWQYEDYTLGGYWVIEKGTILELLKIEIHNSNEPSFAPCTLYLAYRDKNDKHNRWKILKFPYSDRSDVLTAIPNTKAAEVLFGPKA